MRTTILIAALSVATACAQVGAPPQPVAAKATAPVGSAAKTSITRQSFKTLEDHFNEKLATFNSAEPIYMLGATRGVYLEGFGTIFSVELDLIQSPTINPFHRQILKEEVDATHSRKLKQLPLLEKAVQNQMMSAARSLDAVPANEQFVMVVRLDYQNWENTAGLPGQILLRADRKSVAAGQIQMEEQ
ncbi:MAG TPA: hypothetical protein VGS58_17615 [Candidatus Sulfopaludibacter sp.]|nr:hypothetical protein [Candidatus Sulfopaludibacter sp.]